MKVGVTDHPRVVWACCYIYTSALSPSTAYGFTASEAEGLKSLQPIKTVGWLFDLLRILYQLLQVCRMGCDVKTMSNGYRKKPLCGGLWNFY
jgi:hypothetical protein